jgi:hypothetical protein
MQLGSGAPDTPSLLLDRVAAADWTSLRRVIARKTFLFPKPDKKAKTRTYVAMCDLVAILSESGDWLRVEYVNGQKRVGRPPRLGR